MVKLRRRELEYHDGDRCVAELNHVADPSLVPILEMVTLMRARL